MKKSLPWRAFAIIFCLVTSCVTYQPKPLVPAQKATEFQARTLDNEALRKFVETDLGHEVAWPLRTWDLTTLTSAAFYYHPDLAIARAQLDVAEAGVDVAAARRNPSISFAPGTNLDAAEGISPWILSYALNIPIETAGKRGHRMDQARNLSEAARLHVASTAWQIRSRLRASLLKRFSIERRMRLLREEADFRAQSTKAMEQRLAHGEASRPDAAAIRHALDEVDFRIAEAVKEQSTSQAELAAALGVTAKSVESVSITAAFDTPLPAARIPHNLREQALSNRPEILEALAQYEASQSALQLEIAKQYPDIQIGPGYAWDQGDRKWSIGLSLDLPVFDRNQGGIRKAEASRAEAAARFTAVQARVIGEIDQAVKAYAGALDQLFAAEKLVRSEQRQMESMHAMYRAGEADLMDILDARVKLNGIMEMRRSAAVKAQEALGGLEDAVEKPVESFESFES